MPLWNPNDHDHDHLRGKPPPPKPRRPDKGPGFWTFVLFGVVVLLILSSFLRK